MDPIRVLVVDDHDPFIRGLTALLRSAAGLEMIGSASTGAQAVSLVTRLQPDVVLMDIKMPDTNGIDWGRLSEEDLAAMPVLNDLRDLRRSRCS